MCFFNSAEYTYLEQTKLISTLKHLSCRKYSFQNYSILTGKQFARCLGSITHGFLSRVIYVFRQLSCIQLFGTKRAYLHLGKPT
jgi:hypothetical protein